MWLARPQLFDEFEGGGETSEDGSAEAEAEEPLADEPARMTPERPLRDDALELADAGWPLVTVHPRWLVPDELLAFVQLWEDCGGETLRHLPLPGGAAEQPVLAMEAFSVLAAQLGRVRAAERKAAETEAESKSARG